MTVSLLHCSHNIYFVNGQFGNAFPKIKRQRNRKVVGDPYNINSERDNMVFAT